VRIQNGRRGRAEEAAASITAPRRANTPISAPAMTSAPDQMTAERQCICRYSPLSRALVLAARAQHHRAIGRGLVGVEQVGAHHAVEREAHRPEPNGHRAHAAHAHGAQRPCEPQHQGQGEQRELGDAAAIVAQGDQCQQRGADHAAGEQGVAVAAAAGVAA
jgi:hypothetical protein